MTMLNRESQQAIQFPPLKCIVVLCLVAGELLGQIGGQGSQPTRVQQVPLSGRQAGTASGQRFRTAIVKLRLKLKRKYVDNDGASTRLVPGERAES